MCWEMWVSKIKIVGETTLIGGLCKKYGISATGYPLSNTVRGDEILTYFLAFLFCDDNKKAAFLRDLKNHDRIINAELKDHCIIGQMREPIELAEMYQYNIVQVEPVKVSSDGTEVWTVASWNKEELMGFCELMECKYGSTLLKMREEPISNISVLTIHPELTDSQRRAIYLALEHGYYNIPRDIKLETLAELMGVSYSTFQVHLRKAEKKLLPYFFENSDKRCML